MFRNPRGKRIQQFFPHVGILAAAPGWNVERVVSVGKEPELGPRAEARHDGLKLSEVGELIPRSLQEKER